MTNRHPLPFLCMLFCFSRLSIMEMCFMLESGKKRGEKPAPQASESCGVSVSQDRQLCFTLPTSFQCAVDVLRMNNLIRRGTGTCQGHTGVSGSARMEPGLSTPPASSSSPKPALSKNHLVPCTGLWLHTHLICPEKPSRKHTNPAPGGTPPR